MNRNSRIVLALLGVLSTSLGVSASLSDITFADGYNTNDLPPVAEGEKILVTVLCWVFQIL
jgi:hypothetical protein